MSGARRPDVGASLRDFLRGDVPSARDEPARDEVDGGSLVAGGRLNGEQFCGECDDVGHGRQISREEEEERGRRV